MYYNKLRALILVGWSLTIVSVTIAFVTAFFSPIAPDITTLTTSMGAIIGLLSPHLTLIYEFFLSNERKENRKLDKTFAYTVISMCALYWLVFASAVWMGITFRAFSQIHDGNGVELATSVVVALAGTLSFLAIKPTTKLFMLAETSVSNTEDAKATKDAR